jgi:protein SCO1/2
MDKTVARLAAGIVGLGLAVAAGLVAWPRFFGAADPFSDCRGGAVADGGASIGGPFTLTNGAGARVTDTDVVTKPTLIYFGYSFCPDVCPVDLARNAAAADLAAETGTDLGLVFISIDPDRDTPEVASEYAAYIHPEMIGLSGSADDVAAAASAYRVYFRRSGDDPEFYLMDHSTFTYLAAPGHPFLEFYPTDATPEAIADSVACYAGAL